jgi:alpha 1,2-mannosyltransferase
MVDNIEHLVPELPYHAQTRGIVMTAGGPYIDILLVSIRMLRRVGSQLPVEVFLDTGSDYDHRLCEKILPALNAKCKILSDIWSTTPSSEKLKSYQYKVFALLFSSFEDVLFLDADAFPAHNPDRVLDEEPFNSRGLVTWPDFWALSSSSLFYHIAVIPPPALNERASSESGIMLFSKRRHAGSILLATYYNYYGPKIYYPLLSQGAGGEGDKETFLHAAMVMGEEFYAIRSPVTVIGRWMDEKWYSAGMKQADPTEDFQKQADSDMERAGTLFVHNNNLKLNPKRVFDEDYHWRDGFGNLKRLWGDKESLVNEFGRDIEKEMWEELIAVACTIGDDECERARSHYRTVYLPDEGE